MMFRIPVFTQRVTPPANPRQKPRVDIQIRPLYVVPELWKVASFLPPSPVTLDDGTDVELYTVGLAGGECRHLELMISTASMTPEALFAGMGLGYRQEVPDEAAEADEVSTPLEIVKPSVRPNLALLTPEADTGE